MGRLLSVYSIDGGPIYEVGRCTLLYLVSGTHFYIQVYEFPSIQIKYIFRWFGTTLAGVGWMGGFIWE
jgi:hypothetical protein